MVATNRECKVLNSHDQTRDSRQMDKAIIDMATRSWSPSIRSLLVELLNEANTEVREAHESAEGHAILDASLRKGTSDEPFFALTSLFSLKDPFSALARIHLFLLKTNCACADNTARGQSITPRSPSVNAAISDSLPSRHHCGRAVYKLCTRERPLPRIRAHYTASTGIVPAGLFLTKPAQIVCRSVRQNVLLISD